MNVLMTRSTKEQRLSFEGYHPYYPGRFGPPWVLVQVAHLSHMMHFYIIPTSAEFAHFCKQSLYEF